VIVVVVAVAGWGVAGWLLRRLRDRAAELTDVRTVAADALVQARIAQATTNRTLEGWRGTLTQWRRFTGPGEDQFLAAAEAQFTSDTPIGQAGDDAC